MRPTLHEYNLQKLSDLDCTAISDVLNFTKLTNSAPRLGDFVPCDEDGNVLKNPLKDSGMTIVQFIKSIGGIKAYKNHPMKGLHAAYQSAQGRVIFAGFEQSKSGNLIQEGCVDNGEYIIIFREKGIFCSKLKWGSEFEINRIEDLPREIEFKEGVI